MNFKEKVVLITGGSSGIGAATAIYFSTQGANLALVGKNDTNLRRIASYCEKFKNVKTLAIVADLTIPEDVERVVNETIKVYDKIDVLINNAGVTSLGGIKDTTLEEYDRVMSTNLRAVFHLTKVAVPYLIRSKGNIVNVSSVSGTKPNAQTLAYNVSKAGLDHFTRCTALELAADGVRVNSVNPNFVKTNLLKNTGISETQLELIESNVVRNTPLKNMISGDEVSGVIGFLASEKAKSITGCCYAIDGGASLK